MIYPLVEYVQAPDGTTDFDVPFPFLSRSHVEVLVNEAQANILEWIGDRRLRLTAPVRRSDRIRVQRNTPIETALVKFQDGAVLTQEDLNTAVNQLLFKQQELQAQYDGALKSAYRRIVDANGLHVDPDAIMDELANMVLEDEVLAMFRQRIADIDLTAQQLADQAFKLTDATNKIAQQSTDTSKIKNTLSDLAKDLTALQGVVDALGSLEDGTGLATVIKNERDERIMGDTALAATVALLGAKSGTSSSFILDLNSVKVSPTETLAQRLTTIKSATDGNAVAIQTAQKTLSDAISAEATERSTLGATLRTEYAAAVDAERKARVDAVSAEAQARNTLAATLRGETSAAVENERKARVDAVSAEASSRDQLAATLRGETDNKVTAAISQEQKVRADAISAEATSRTQLAATLRGEIASSIQSEAKMRADQDSVFTNLFTLLGAKSSNGAAFILNDNTVQLSNGQSLGTRLSGIDTRIGNVSGSLQELDRARAADKDALAESIRIVRTDLDRNVSTVSTLSQSLNGVQARYGVSLDVNGYVTGFIQNNDGRSGTFAIVANRFAIVDPGNGSPYTPFEVVNGVTYIKNAVIGNQRINSDNLQQSAVQQTVFQQTDRDITVYYG